MASCESDARQPLLIPLGVALCKAVGTVGICTLPTCASLIVMLLLGTVCGLASTCISLRRSGGEVLLLKRSSAHNDQKWGLPGGNVEEGDKDLIDTAKREATEEMGKLPPFDVKGEILTVYVSLTDCSWPCLCGSEMLHGHDDRCGACLHLPLGNICSGSTRMGVQSCGPAGCCA